MPVEGSAPAPRPLAELLCGVTLEQYTGVTVGLAEEFPLDTLLANEGIDAFVWPAAEEAWKERLATDGPEGALFAAFRAKRSEAEDWLDREVSPIDSDLGAWLSFLHAWSTHPEPFELLARAGVRLSDIARIQRRWTSRMVEEPALQKQAAEIGKKGPGPLPPIHVGVAALTPFPWSRGRAKTPEPATTCAASGDGDTGELPLDRYAAITAELAERSSNEAHVLEKYGLSPPVFSTFDTAWKERLRADIGLERDYRRLFEHQRARLHASAERDERAPAVAARGAALVSRDLDAPAPAPPLHPVHVAPAHLADTSLLLEIPRGPALPFVRGAPAPEIATSAPTEAAIPRSRPDLGGTALAVDVPRGPALPFSGAVEPPVAAGPAKLGGTSLTVDIPRGPALPSVEGSAAVQRVLANKPATPFIMAEGGTTVESSSPALTPGPPGSETEDISAAVQRVLANKPATPFIMAEGGTTAESSSPALTPRLASGETEDISAVQRVLANKPATPFIRAEGGTTAESSAPALTPRPPRGETEDISAAVQRVLANKPATPFAAASVGETAQPSALAFTPRLPHGETADISAAVAEALPGRSSTPFAGGSGAAVPSAPAPPLAERAKPSASAAPKVDSETLDISAAVAQVLARRAAMPFGGVATPAPASVEPTNAPAAPPPAASVLALPAARADAPGSTTADISSVVQQVLAAARSAVPFSSKAATSESAAPPHHRQPPMIPGDAAPSLLSAPVAAPTTASPPTTAPIQTPSPPAPRSPVTPRASAPAPLAAGPPPPPHLPNLSLEQYADLWIQLWMDPARAAEILVRWGIRDASSWAALQWLWQHRISTDPALSRQWTHVIAQLKAARGIR